jgi:DNA-binding MarR family transcriptional regulator
MSIYYDDFLKTEGLTVTQYAILVNIGRAAEGVKLTDLAEKMGMERTTLTRNLLPLERAGWVGVKAGADKRARLLVATPKGIRKLNSSYAKWAAAQHQFLEAFGPRNVDSFKALMDRAIGCSRAPAEDTPANPAPQRSTRAHRQ